MSLHVIVGAGPIGRATATLLAERGEQVRIVTRSGGGPEHPAVERVAHDATDADGLSRLAEGADVLYNCANPGGYQHWERDWPPLAASLLTAAERTGAVLAVTGNLYVYGPVDGPMTEDLPLAAPGHKGRLRARMWTDALEAQRGGRIRGVFEARGSDYLGAGAVSLPELILLPAMRAGRRAWVPGALDAPHSFTYTGDMARTLVELAGQERAWGHAWHVPSNPALTVRQLADAIAAAGALPRPKLSRVPGPVLSVGALVNPFMREFTEVAYQWNRPYVLDSSRVTREFGLAATPMDRIVAEVATGRPAR